MPFSYLEYKIIEKFGWTLQELYAQPYEKIDLFLKIMDIESQFEEREARKLEKYAKR